MRLLRRSSVLIVLCCLAAAGGIVAGRAASAVPWQPAPPSTSPAPPAPAAKKKLLIVGDSVIQGVEVYGALPALRSALPAYDVTFDAQESRSTVGGAGVILAHNPAQFDTVVIALGSNDAGSPEVFKGRVKTVLDELKAVPHVFWMNVREKGRYAAAYQQSNAALALIAGSYPNTQVIDWNGFAATLPPGQFVGDGLHLSAPSAAAMASLIAQAVQGTTPFARSTAPTTTTTTTAATSMPGATAPAGASRRGSAGSSSNGLLIGLVVGGVIVVGFLVAAIAGWRRAKNRRREERRERLDALFQNVTGTPPSFDGVATDESAAPAESAEEPTREEGAEDEAQKSDDSG